MADATITEMQVGLKTRLDSSSNSSQARAKPSQRIFSFRQKPDPDESIRTQYALPPCVAMHRAQPLLPRKMKFWSSERTTTLLTSSQDPEKAAAAIRAQAAPAPASREIGLRAAPKGPPARPPLGGMAARTPSRARAHSRLLSAGRPCRAAIRSGRRKGLGDL